MEIFALNAVEISKFMDRARRQDTIPEDPRIDDIFREILRIANQFVPSEAGSILLDDPILKMKHQGDRTRTDLVFIACFGDKAKDLPGARIPANKGIIGHTYLSGESYISTDVKTDKNFYGQLDKITQYQSQSIICVPIIIERSICGVLELINRRDRINFLQTELELLEIFARYISTSMQNVLDANRNRELAKRDDLTGLYNDRYFYRRLTEEIERAEQEKSNLSLIFLDLDKFKAVNDHHGHLAGSQTLREVGMILRTAVDVEGSTLARYGGDEFVIILPDTDLKGVLRVGERIRQQIEEFIFVQAQDVTEGPPLNIAGVITASIGVASYHESGVVGESLDAKKITFIRLADQAMYHSKAKGKNCVSYSGEPGA